MFRRNCYHSSHDSDTECVCYPVRKETCLGELGTGDRVMSRKADGGVISSVQKKLLP